MARNLTAEIDETIATVDLQTQIQALKTDITALTAAMTEYAKVQRASIASAAADSMQTLREKGAEKVDAAAEIAGKSYAQAEDLVRRNPAGALAAAAALGFAVGLMTSKR